MLNVTFATVLFTLNVSQKVFSRKLMASGPVNPVNQKSYPGITLLMIGVVKLIKAMKMIVVLI